MTGCEKQNVEWHELFENRHRLRDWLVSIETVVDEQRTNWWLGVKIAAEGEVDSALWSSIAPARDALNILADVIEAAAERDVLSPADAAIALGNYSSRLAEAGVTTAEVPVAFLPETALKRCLALLPEDRDEVAEQAKVWTTPLRAEVGAWLPLRPILP